ncbi:MAG: DHA2 family efflux MFS transporter permease subunit [Acidimicrobiia bacterium]|nr:DHA2 family efflux MFS transporter permease subunit [Acidimicrobiia bacterium]
MTVLGGLMVGLFIAAIDQTIVATALPEIVSDLGGLDQLSWVIVAYLLTSTASTPLWGKCGDLFGRRQAYQASILVFLAGSLACGFAPSMTGLVFARALQGIGGGGLFALSFAIVGDIIPPRQRGRYMGYFTAVFASAGVIGPLAGGFITDHVGWRWIFTVNLPIGAVALVVTSVALRLPFPRRQARLDLLGAGALVAAVTTLTLVTVWGGDQYGWASTPIVGLSVASVVLFVAFFFWEARVEEPIVPLRLFRNPVTAVTLLLSFLLGPVMYGVSSFLPLYLQGTQGVSATNSGLLLSPNMLGLTVMSIITGRMTTRTGRYKHWVVLGTLLLALDVLLLTRLTADTGILLVGALMVVLGMGLGACMPTLSVSIQNAVPIADLGVATSTLTFCRTLGGSIGVAAMGAVLKLQVEGRLGEVAAANPLPPGVDASTLANRPTDVQALPDPLRGLVEGALAHGVATAFLAVAPVVIACAVIAWWFPELPLRDSSALVGSPGAKSPADAPTITAAPAH